MVPSISERWYWYQASEMSAVKRCSITDVAWRCCNVDEEAPPDSPQKLLSALTEWWPVKCNMMWRVDKSVHYCIRKSCLCNVLIISVIWYRYIGVLVPLTMLPRRGLLAPLAVPLPSVFFIELGLWPWAKGTWYQATATSGTIVRYERYQNSAIITKLSYSSIYFSKHLSLSKCSSARLRQASE